MNKFIYRWIEKVISVDHSSIRVKDEGLRIEISALGTLYGG